MKEHFTFRTTLLIMLIGLLFYYMPAQAQEKSIADTLVLTYEEGEGFFDNEEVLDITIKFDITRFMREKPDEYMDAVITFYHSPDDSVCYDIKLKSRGERRRELCALPPIRLSFKNTSTVYGDIDSITNIKMVTHCNSPSSYDEYLLKEYLLYKMYNLVTEYSFRVRLLRIKYIDTGARGKYYSRRGFMIEPMDLLEKRLGVFEIENVYLRYNNLVPDILDRMVVFQYMVGNTDWQVITYHNIKIVKPVDQLLGIPIPYDFDYSGFVNTTYAVPAPVFPIKNVKQRYFMGACRPDSTYEKIIGEFMDNKDKFFHIMDGCELLPEKSAKRINDYLVDFFRLCENKRIIKLFRMECEDRRI